MSESERPSGDAPVVRTSRRRAMWMAVAVLLLVAVAGVASGIALERRVLHPHGWRDRGPGRGGEAHRGGPRGRAETTAEGRARFRARMVRDLELTAEQAARIDTILERQRPRMDSLRAALEPPLRAAAEETRRQIEAVLTPEQREKFRSRGDGRRGGGRRF